MNRYIRNDIKNKKQSNNKTTHFENEREAYLPLNNANAKFFNNFLISLYLKDNRQRTKVNCLYPHFYSLFTFASL